MSTVAELVDATLNRWLYGTYRAKSNVADGALDPATDTILCKFDPQTIGVGSFLALEDELVEVLRAPQGFSLLVLRGQRGTTADSHPDGCAIEINPRYPRFNVRAALLDEVVSWPETMFKVTQFDTVPASSSGTIDVSSAVSPAEVRRVLAVWRSNRAHADDRFERVSWQSAKDARGPGTCDIYLNDRVDSSRRTYRVVVGTAFDTGWFDDDTDLQSDVGIPRSAEDVLQLGVAYRLVTGREAKRLFTEQQGESRDATEVGPLDLARFGIQLLQLRDAGLARETRRLKDRYGVGVTGG